MKKNKMKKWFEKNLDNIVIIIGLSVLLAMILKLFGVW